MLDFLNAIPSDQRLFALLVFVLGGAFSAYTAYRRGNKAGPEAPKVQEFYAAGALADMGPVKELVQNTGMLIQQQVRTNMALENVASAMKEAAAAYVSHMEIEKREREMDEAEQRGYERAKRDLTK